MLVSATILDKSGPSLMQACLGLCGESGEVADAMKKHLFHDKWVTKEELLLEIGDVLYYIAMAASAFSMTMTELAEMNIRKLWKRYPEKAQAFLEAQNIEDLSKWSEYMG